MSERIDHPEGFAVVSQGDGESQIQVDIFLTQDGGKKNLLVSKLDTVWFW